MTRNRFLLLSALALLAGPVARAAAAPPPPAPLPILLAPSTLSSPLLAATAPASLSPLEAGAGPTRSVTHTLDGVFLEQGADGRPRNQKWDFFFEPGSSFHRIVVDFDFFLGEFGGSVNGETWDRYQYILFWLQKDGFSRWDQMIGFGFLWEPDLSFETQSNAGSPTPLRFSTRCNLQENTWYHVQFVYDTRYGGTGLQWGEILRDGQWVCSGETAVGLGAIETSYAFIGFGTWDTDEGPEGITANWKWANLRVEFVGDLPAGRRPRRR